METWIWISLYAVQTLVGAVLWRKYSPKEGYYRIENGLQALFACSLVISNLIGLLIVLGWFIDFLAGVKDKTEEIKCTGNNGNGCFMDSCGHNCGCQEFGEKLKNRK